MPSYEINIPGGGTYQVDSANELSEQDAYKAALSQSQPAQSSGGGSDSPGLIKNFTEELRQGVRQTLNPSETDFLGADSLSKIPVVGDLLKNVVGSTMGAGRAIYSAPTALSKTFVGDPLRSAGYQKTGDIADTILPLALSFLGGGVPFAGKALSMLGKGEEGAGLATKLLTKGLVGSELGTTAKIAGRVLDPLASGGQTTLQKMQGGFNKREETLGRLNQELDTATTGRSGIADRLSKAKGGADDIQRQMDELAQAANESKDTQLAQTERIPPKPEVPTIPNVPGAAPADKVGEAFREDVLPGARKALYGESSARYEALKTAGEAIPIEGKDLDAITETLNKLTGESRTPRSAGTVAEQLQLGEQKTSMAPQLPGGVDNPVSIGSKEMTAAGDSWRTMDPKQFEIMLANKSIDPTRIVQMVQQGLAGEQATMANAMRADQILSVAKRAYEKSGDLASRSAVTELQRPIRAALDNSPLAEGLNTAKALHRETSELVGPRSLAERVFRKTPEQVVDHIFLPEGKPNISTISDAKAIYEKVAPGEWPKVTGEALAKFQERVRGNTGEIDPGKFQAQWKRYRGTFEAALPPEGFKAVDSIAGKVREFNQSRRNYGELARRAKEESGLIKEFYSRQRAQLGVEAGQLRPQLRAANEESAGILKQMQEADKHIGEIHKNLGLASSFGMNKGDALKGALSSPYMFIAIAQFGQGLQALFTGNMSGAMKQFGQGVIWATLGNPLWLSRLAQNPNLAKAVARGIAIQSGAKTAVQDARLLRAALTFMGDKTSEEAQ